jgi:hypothetical protein
MLRHVAGFELRYQLHSPGFWVTFLVFFLMAFAAAASDQRTIGGKGGNVHVNAPFVHAAAASRAHANTSGSTSPVTAQPAPLDERWV